MTAENWLWEAQTAYRIVAVALGECSFLPGSWDKRFCRNMAAQATRSRLPYTEAQQVHLLRLAHKYRRQLPTATIEVSLDQAERAAQARVAKGQGALADFTPTRKRRIKPPKAEAPPPDLPLLSQGFA